MKRIAVGLAVGLLSFPAFAAAPSCPAQPRTRQGAIATERAWVRALETGDRNALSCILAPEFADTNWRGEIVLRKAILEAMRARRPSTLLLSGLSFFQDGGVAIVRGTNRQSNADRRGSASVRFTDIFVYRDGAWRAIFAQETLIADAAR